MRASPSTRGVSRSRHLALHPLGAVLVVASFAACSDDDRQRVVDVWDQSDGTVGDTSNPTSFSGEITSPAEGAVFGEGTPVPFTLNLTTSGSTRWAGYKASIAFGSETSALTDLPIDANGSLTQQLEAGPGAHLLRVTVTSPSGETVLLERNFSINTPPPKPTLAWDDTSWPGTSPTTVNDLVVLATGVEDPTFQGEGVTVVYRWNKVGGSTALPSSTNTLSNIHTTRGDQVEVFVKLNDGFVDGPEARLETTIGNAAPTCTGVSMNPTAARVDQAITCACVGYEDADGDADASSCTFTDLTSGDTLGTPGDCILPAGSLASGMEVSCTVTPHDGTTAGTPLTTPEGNEVLVLNSAPSAPVATLTPAEGNALTEFSCALTTAGVDTDGDSLTHTVSWTVAGAPVASTATSATGATLGAAKGQALCCRISASDGSTPVASAPSCVTLTNAPPPEVNVFTRVRGGGTATRRSILDCEPEDTTDPDGDPVTITYAWYVDTNAIPNATSSSLAADSIPRGSVVSCQATICDATACTEPIASKNALQINNSLPELGGVVIVPDQDESHPGETLTCAFSGWDDPDGDAVDVTYEWVLVVNGVETIIESATSADLEVEVTMPAGSQLICRVTPWNDTNAGPTTSSNPRPVGEAIPLAPVVAVLAPAGADGPLTCQTTEAARFIPNGATWTWRWSRNDETIDVPSSTTLAADHIDDCDLVRCWVEIRATGLTLDSNRASSLMPLGLDCDDGNACTTATCLMGGGCNQVSTDGGACDDGDACTDNEICQSGTCVGTLDICKEDRLSVATAAVWDTVLSPTPDGGYLSINGLAMRKTDGNDTRLGEQVDGAALHGGAISPTGRVARVRYAGATGVCSVNANYQCFYFTTRVFNADLVTFTDLPVDVWCGCGATLPIGGTTLARSDESFAVFYEYPASVSLQIVDAALNRTSIGSVATSIYAGAANQDLGWHIASVPDGTDAFMIAWVASNRKAIYAQRYSALGAAEFSEPIVIATTLTTFDAVSIAPMANGRFVVAWQGDGLDGAGQGIRAQRFDDSGTALGSPTVVNEVATGNQLLGGVTAFSNLRYAVVWRDGSTPTARFMARTFTAAADGGEQFVLNESTTVGVGVPSVAAMSNDDFVATWRDGSNVTWTRRYRFDGTYRQGAAEFQANDSSSNQQETPAAASASNGNVMTVYASQVITAGNFGSEIMTRVFDEDGLEVAPERIVYDSVMSYAQTQPTVAGSAAGFVVAWNSEEQDGEGDGIFARRFDVDGAAIDLTTVPVNTTTAGYQRQPAVAMATSGTWVAAWNGQSTTAGSTSDVYARIFPASGLPGSELVLNSTTTNVQERPALAVLPFANDFVAVWQSRSQDGDGLGIFARKFGLDGTAKTVEFPVNSRTAGDQRNPTVAVSQTNQVAICWESVGHITAGKPAVACQYLRTADLLPVGNEFLPFSWADEQASPTIRFLANGQLAVAYHTLGLDSASYAVQLVRVTNAGVPVGPRLNANRMWAESQSRPFVVPLDDRFFVGWQSHLQDGSAGGIYFRILPQP